MGRTPSGSRQGGAGAGARTAPDIIDLDRFMRAGVRPPDPLSTDDELGERLLVDAGGGVGGGAGRRAHRKRYSQDSGVSGDSWSRRARKPHRRTSVMSRNAGLGLSPAGGRPSRDSLSGGDVDKCSSMRAFRSVCERALLDQRRQIARIAQLCERLTEQRAERAAQQPASPDTTDISSSSRSTRDQRRKDKHRREECKTYKIIMNKLDELNQLFASRAARPAPPPPPPARHLAGRRTAALSPQASTLRTSTPLDITLSSHASNCRESGRGWLGARLAEAQSGTRRDSRLHSRHRSDRRGSRSRGSEDHA